MAPIRAAFPIRASPVIWASSAIRDWRSRLGLLAGILVLLGGGARAGEGPAPYRVDVRYEVRIGPVAAFSYAFRADLGSERYFATSEARTLGALHGVFSFTQFATVTGRVVDQAPVADHFESRSEWLFGTRRSEIDYGPGGPARIMLKPGRDPEESDEVPLSAQLEGADPLTATLIGLGRATRDGHCPGRFPIFDGRVRYDVDLVDRGPETLSDGPPGAYAGPARRCEVVFEPLMGFTKSFWRDRARQPPRPVTLWIAQPAGQAVFVPVRLTATFAGTEAAAHYMAAAPAPVAP